MIIAMNLSIKVADNVNIITPNILFIMQHSTCKLHRTHKQLYNVEL